MTVTTGQQIRAWMIHLYTALGGVCGMFALFAAADGTTRLAFMLLVLSMLIDATDGIMARRARVREVLPGFDGAMMDNVIDMLTFVWIPVFIIWRESLLPHPIWTVIPILAGLYAYGQTNMKTPDNFFLGFPSYWNIIALYLYWIQPSSLIAALILILFAILTIIPTRYLYPSKNYVFWKLTWSLGAIWFGMVIYMLFQPVPHPMLILLSLVYPLYYLLASFYVEWSLRRQSVHLHASPN